MKKDPEKGKNTPTEDVLLAEQKAVEGTESVLQHDTIGNKRLTWLQRIRFLQRSVWVASALALLVNILTWALIFWKLPPTDATVFLHYTIYFGIDLTGEWWRLLFIPGTGTLILLIHACVVFFRQATQTSVIPLLSAVLALVYEVLIGVALWFILLTNTSL